MNVAGTGPEHAHQAPSLAELTTMRVGGPATRVITAFSRDDLIHHATELWREEQPWLLLGGGSNTIVSDHGFPGTVLLVRHTGIVHERTRELPQGQVLVRVQAGHDWDQLVQSCVDQGWAGVETLSGIPGRVGAAPVQNIGAYGTELASVLHSVEFLDRNTLQLRRVWADELRLGYRDSAIKQGELEGVVVSIDLLLTDTGDALSMPVAYAQLADALGVERGERVPVAQLRRAVLALRASKGMILDPADHDSWSAGSFFTNPIVSERFSRTLPSHAPRYPVDSVEAEAAITSLEELHAGGALRLPERIPERRIKLSAAWLIEHAGVRAGMSLPGSSAAISSKHTLAITNRGGATAAQVAELARFVVQRVQQEFGVLLVPEPQLYGLDM